MRSSAKKSTGDMKEFCDICMVEIQPGEEHKFDSKTFCEDCCIDLRTPKMRKTHWQYIKSVKTEYLIPGEA